MNNTFTSVLFKPDKYKTYIVKTKKGNFDFSKYDRTGWNLSNITNEIPEFWINQNSYQLIINF